MEEQDAEKTKKYKKEKKTDYIYCICIFLKEQDLEKTGEKKTKIAYLWRNKIERKQEKRKNKDCIFMEE